MRQDAKKKTALFDGVGSSIFSGVSKASKDAHSQFSQHLNTQMEPFVNSTLLLFFFAFVARNAPRFFCFLAFRPNALLVFCEICGRIGNEMNAP